MSSNTAQQHVASTGGISRRRLLGGVLGGSALLAGVPKPTSAAQSPRPLSAQHLHDQLTVLDRDVAANRLHQTLDDAGWRRDLEGAVGHRSPEGSFAVVAVPYTHDDRDAETVLVWTDGDEFDPQIRQIESGGSRRLRMRTTVVDGAGTRSAMVIVPPDVLWFLCRDINWTCLLSIAGAWAGTFSSCGSCFFDPSRLSCLSCVGSVASALGTTLGCSYCND